MLLLARDEDGEAMTDQELRDELVTLLVAGHETTATGLAWAFELLLRNPRVLERLRAALAEGDDAYLDAVVKETLRLRPVVPGVGRVVRGEPFELGGYLIPPGVEINPSIAAIHRRADRYPEPTRVPPGALPRPRRARHLHVDAVRRRHAPLPGRELCHLRDAGRDPPRARAHAARAVGRRPEKARAQGRHDRAEKRRARDPDGAANACAGTCRATLEAAGPPAGGAVSSNRHDRLRSLRCTIRCGQSERSSARWW